MEPTMNRITVNIDGAKIVERFRNFSGEERRYEGRIVNGRGKRNFCIELDRAMAEDFAEFGCYIANIDSEERAPRLQVEVDFSKPKYAPCIYAGTRSGKMHKMDEDDIHRLDEADIEHVDLVINLSPYTGQDGGRRVKAYCKNMYVVYAEDDFRSRYRIDEDEEDIPEELPFN